MSTVTLEHVDELLLLAVASSGDKHRFPTMHLCWFCCEIAKCSAGRECAGGNEIDRFMLFFCVEYHHGG